MRGAICATFMMTFTLSDEHKRAHCSKVPFRSNKAGNVALICRRRGNIEPGFFIDVQKHAGNVINVRRRSLPRVSPAARRCRHRLRPATHASGRRRPRPDDRKHCLPVKEPSEHVAGMSSRAKGDQFSTDSLSGRMAIVIAQGDRPCLNCGAKITVIIPALAMLIDGLDDVMHR
jgi:hypothetical protein